MTSTPLFLIALSLPAADPGPAPSVDVWTALSDGGRQIGPSEAVGLALDVAPEVERARALVARAEAELRAAEVQLAPRLTLGARAARIGGFPDAALGSPPNQITIQIPRTQASLTSSLQYDIVGLFARVLPELEAGRARIEAERYQATSTREALALSALEAYWMHARARGEVVVADASLAEIDAQLARIERMLEAGLSTPADREGAVARRAAALQRRSRALGAEETTRVSVNALLGLAPSARWAVPAGELSETRTEALDVAELVGQAREARPELLALRALVTSVEARRRAVLGRKLPRLGVEAAATYAQPNPNVIPPQEQFDGSWSVSASLSWSPNDLWAGSMLEESLDEEIRRSRADLATLERAVQVDVYRQLAALRTAHEMWSASAARLAAAAASLESRKSAFAAGAGIYSEVLTAEAELSDARLSQLSALVETRLARVRLDRAIGQLVKTE